MDPEKSSASLFLSLMKDVFFQRHSVFMKEYDERMEEAERLLLKFKDNPGDDELFMKAGETVKLAHRLSTLSVTLGLISVFLVIGLPGVFVMHWFGRLAGLPFGILMLVFAWRLVYRFRVMNNRAWNGMERLHREEQLKREGDL